MRFFWGGGGVLTVMAHMYWAACVMLLGIHIQIGVPCGWKEGPIATTTERHRAHLHTKSTIFVLSTSSL
jgi:hypothetical protein